MGIKKWERIDNELREKGYKLEPTGMSDGEYNIYKDIGNAWLFHCRVFSILEAKQFLSGL